MVLESPDRTLSDPAFISRNTSGLTSVSLGEIQSRACNRLFVKDDGDAERKREEQRHAERLRIVAEHEARALKQILAVVHLMLCTCHLPNIAI